MYHEVEIIADHNKPGQNNKWLRYCWQLSKEQCNGLVRSRAE